MSSNGLAENGLTDKLYSEALDLHRRHRLADAERSYAAVLDIYAGHVGALNGLGVVAIQTGRPRLAVELIEKAIGLDPDLAVAYFNLGNALHALNRLPEALSNFDTAIALNGNLPVFSYNRANLLRDMNCLTESLEGYDKAILAKHDYSRAHNGRGLVLKRLNRIEEAIQAFDKAIQFEPDFIDAHNNRGNAFSDLENYEAALSSYERLVLLQPNNPVAYNNRGSAQQKLRQFERALESFDDAISRNLSYVKAHYNRGNVLRAISRTVEALDAYDQAILLDPNFANAYNSRGHALFLLGRFEDAVMSYKSAIQLAPHAAYPRDGLANALRKLGRIDEAIKYHHEAISLEPGNPTLHTNLIFSLNFQHRHTTEDLCAERRRWNALHARHLLNHKAVRFKVGRRDRPLRVGYVSSFFCHQAATYAFGGVILNHDRKAFEVFCYSDTVMSDDFTHMLKERADTWHDTAGLSDQKLTDLIKSDEIDILVDLVGHMRANRLLVFARRAAPVQVTAWGEPTGTGLETMDYLLGDPALIPDADRQYLTEQVSDLPNFLGYFTPVRTSSFTTLPALQNGFVTFGCFNRIDKINREVLLAWAKILAEMPSARLVIKSQDLSHPTNHRWILDILSSAGVNPDRVSLVGPKSNAAHLESYSEIDIALDTFPHGGGMTTLDALWMGVPVITWSGRTISSRLASASLIAVRLYDCIAKDVAGYVNLALEKAANLSALNELRAALRNRVIDSGIGDSLTYARSVENAYHVMWDRYCDSQTTEVS